MINPFISNRKFLIPYLVIWFSLMVLIIYVGGNILPFNIRDIIVDEVTHDLVMLVLSFSFWYPALYISFEKYSFFSIVVKHFIAATAASFLWMGISYVISVHLIKFSPEYLEFYNSSLLWRFLGGYLAYGSLTIINYLIIYYRNFQDKQIQESQLVALVRDSELRSLKYQINPHFIFNSLNSIASLTVSNPVRAREMTIKLSDFFRNTISRNEKQLTHLNDELNNISLYLEIEKIRFDEKIVYVDEVNENCRNINLPNMILQPLIENAIKHGVYESLEPVTIKISCTTSDKYACLSVENNYDPEGISRKGEGIGLKNIKSRLSLFYKQENLVEIINDKNGIFKVNLYIPLSGEV